jgi:hypothetical protein
LEFIAEEFVDGRFLDPANSNNVVSDELDFDEKRAVVVAAQKSLGKESWERVVW